MTATGVITLFETAPQGFLNGQSEVVTPTLFFTAFLFHFENLILKWTCVKLLSVSVKTSRKEVECLQFKHIPSAADAGNNCTETPPFHSIMRV